MKQFISNSKIFLTYSIYSIKFLWKESKSYLIFMFLDLILSAVQVFPGMYLLSNSVDLLTKKVPFNQYMITILAIILIMVVIALLKGCVSNQMGYAKKIMNHKIRMEINEICIQIEYKNLEEKAFIEQKDFAQQVVNNGSLELFVQSMAVFQYDLRNIHLPVFGLAGNC